MATKKFLLEVEEGTPNCVECLYCGTTICDVYQEFCERLKIDPMQIVNIKELEENNESKS